MAMFFENFNNTQQFMVTSVAGALCLAKFSAAEIYRSFVLRNDHSQLVFTSVRMDMKCLVEVWARQQCFFSHDFFDICPFELDAFTLKSH